MFWIKLSFQRKRIKLLTRRLEKEVAERQLEELRDGQQLDPPISSAPDEGGEQPRSPDHPCVQSIVAVPPECLQLLGRFWMIFFLFAMGIWLFFLQDVEQTIESCVCVCVCVCVSIVEDFEMETAPSFLGKWSTCNYAIFFIQEQYINIFFFFSF